MNGDRALMHGEPVAGWAHDSHGPHECVGVFALHRCAQRMNSCQHARGFITILLHASTGARFRLGMPSGRRRCSRPVF